MTAPAMRQLTDAAKDLAWLGERTSDDVITGYDAVGWPCSAWLMHAMYEMPYCDDAPTFHEVRQDRLRQGLETPAIVAGINFDEVSVATGVPIGYAKHPGPGWHRLRWRQLANRLGVGLEGQRYPPGDAWLPYRSWPIHLRPPCEGSLDQESLDRLVKLLAEHSSDGLLTQCFAYYVPMTTSDWNTTTLFEGPLAAIPALAESCGFSPTNFWPHDRSWLIYTDYDLWATRLSGSSSLVEAALADTELEIIQVTTPDV